MKALRTEFRVRAGPDLTHTHRYYLSHGLKVLGEGALYTRISLV